MKKIYFNLTSFALAGISIAFAACTNEPAALIEQAESNAPIIYASQELQAKSSITVDGEGVGTIYWSPADNISIFYGASTPVLYTSTNLAPETTAAFTTSAIIGSTELASTNIWGLYPHNPSAVCDGSSISTTLPSTQYGVSDTFDDDLFMTVAHSDDTNLHFYNVCGGIKFSLSRDDITAITFSGNNSEDIAGDITVSFVEGLPKVSVDSGEKTITVTPKGGGTFASDTYYYIVALPQTLSGGFTMTFETETQHGTFVYDTKAVSIKRSVFGKKDDIDGYAGFVSKPAITDLSAAGTANCYIVSAAGDYKFNASVKGNSIESVGTPVSADVLWETFGTSVAPSIGDLVNSVSLQDGFVHFSATDSKGNALIAVKDSEGTILWSWHIWLTDDPIEQEYKSSAGIMMDRNIGATNASLRNSGTCGLLFQWGRKDPMIGLSPLQFDYSTTQYSGDQIKVVKSTETIGTISYSIEHPTTFIHSSSPVTNYDWLYSGTSACDNSRWSSIKTIYDPCPSGWRIPDGIGSSVWEKANGSSSFLASNFTFYSTSLPNIAGVDCTDQFAPYSSTPIWYPLAGYAQQMSDPYNNYLTGGRSSGQYWTCTPLETDAYGYNNISIINIGSSYINFTGCFRYRALSVRCQKM